MSKKNRSKTDEAQVSRRRLMQTAAAGAGTLAVGAGAGPAAVSPIENANAGWWDDIKDGIGQTVSGPGAIFQVANFLSQSGDTNETEQKAIQQSYDREMGTLADQIRNVAGLNENTLSIGKDAIFRDAKISAIEALRDGKTKSEVQQAGINAAKSYWETFEKNHYEVAQAVDQTYTAFFDQIKNTSGVNPRGILFKLNNSADGGEIQKKSKTTVQTPVSGLEYQFNQYRIIVTVQGDDSASTGTLLDDVTGYNNYGSVGAKGNVIVSAPSDPRNILGSIWSDRTNEIQTLWDDGSGGGLKNEISTWAGNAYDSVAAGDLPAGDLLTTGDIVGTIAEENPERLATAHLRAANIPSDVGTRSTVSFSPGSGEASVTVTNALLASTADGLTLSPGETYDPSSLSGDALLNYRPSEAVVEVDQSTYATQLDGGVLSLTAVPQVFGFSNVPTYSGVSKWIGGDLLIQVSTNADETVSFAPSELTEQTDLSPATATVDLSSKLESPISEVTQIQMFAVENEATTAPRNAYIETSFTVEETMNAETGDNLDSVTFERNRELQTADNYQTSEEINQLLEENKELRNEIRENASGGFGGFGGLGGLGIPTLPGFGEIETIVIVLGGGWLLSQFN